MIKPGDELKIKVGTSIDMPVFSREAFRQEELLLDGLKVRINSVKLEKDPFGVENTLTLSLGIDNYTDYTFSTFDIALASNTEQVFFPSPFGDTSLWFKTITPGERVVGKLSFCYCIYCISGIFSKEGLDFSSKTYIYDITSLFWGCLTTESSLKKSLKELERKPRLR